ncbi:Glycine betaine uptake system permease protein YehY [Serratia plymuthica]|uniref:ABC transporter permease n=1 Tax=Serratia plymuthica TaxID=82996 RepID=UPI00034C7D5C|nr:ABC transporter permease subunit [Serratia plymuthica]QJW56491.1 Glycine betaine uptake system permease protein YehY [Serratia plymuthica]
MIEWQWIADNAAMIGQLFLEHLQMVVLSLTLGTLLTALMLLVCIHWPSLAAPLISVSGVLFTIPSLAMFILLLPWTGLSVTTAVIGLTLYSLLILMRNVLAGMQKLPTDILESARALGYTRLGRFIEIEIFLILPSLFAGLRIAAVTLVGLVIVTALIGQGGLGQLMIVGFNQNFLTPILTSLALSLLLSLTLDLLITRIGYRLTGWTR